MTEATSSQTVRPDETLRAAALRMSEGEITCLVAVEAGTPLGVVTDRDLALDALCGRVEPSAPVAALRWRPLVTVVRGERADVAVRLMEAHGLRHLPVSGEAGRIVGMVAVEDALTLLLQELVELARVARNGSTPSLGREALRAEDAQVALPSIDGGASASALAELIRRSDAQAILVFEGGPVGIVSERDLLPVVAGTRRADVARDLVSPHFATVNPRDPLEKVVELMASHGVDRVTVVRGERTLGMVSLQGVLARLALEFAELLAQSARPTGPALASLQPPASSVAPLRARPADALAASLRRH
jgi:CBS domain-containing protein